MSQDTIRLVVTNRAITGKSVKHLRQDGQVPAVIHDHGKASVIVQGDEIALLKAYRAAGKHHPIELKTDSKTYTAMIKTAEFEPRKHRLTHIVFNAVTANQKVEAEVPIHPRYDEGNEASPAERAGLMVLSNTEVVNVEAVPAELPDVLYYDAEKLAAVGDHVTIADLIVPKGVVITDEASQTIASVFEPSAVAAANDAAGGDAEEPVEESASEEVTTESADASTANDTAQ